MSSVAGRSVLVVERDDARAGRWIMALRDLGVQATRFGDDERGRAQASASRADAVIVDATRMAEAEAALAWIASDPSLSAAVVLRIVNAWSGDEPAVATLEAALKDVTPRADRSTKSLRAVSKSDPPAAPTPSAGVRRIASARSTEKYGAVAAPIAKEPGEVAVRASSVPPPVLAPEVLTAKKKKEGYVFPTKRAATDLEDESSSKATSLDLTAVPSSILERAGLPDTDRFDRVPASRPWLPWVIGLAVALSIGAVVAALVTR